MHSSSYKNQGNVHKSAVFPKTRNEQSKNEIFVAVSKIKTKNQKISTLKTTQFF